jgi:excisionase family DNA binding protein
MGTKADAMIVTLTVAELRAVIREEIQSLADTKPAPPREWLTAEALAQEFKLPKTWFEERGREGEIARTKPGRYVLFKRRDVEEYFERHKELNGSGWKRRQT